MKKLSPYQSAPTLGSDLARFRQRRSRSDTRCVPAFYSQARCFLSRSTLLLAESDESDYEEISGPHQTQELDTSRIRDRQAAPETAEEHDKYTDQFLFWSTVDMVTKGGGGDAGTNNTKLLSVISIDQHLRDTLYTR